MHSQIACTEWQEATETNARRYANQTLMCLPEYQHRTDQDQEVEFSPYQYYRVFISPEP